ncbi:DNA-binding protein [Actinoplanes sp. NPDC051851]|uniref:helix-turn-helix transcriptional regulator n=1 Tax=Actinoplanes sp. NPDC051851 TaxID=3154753 RepID=UPI0034331D2E
MRNSGLQLLGAHEIRLRLGGRISRQRVHSLTNRASFPEPVARLKQGKVWLTEEVDAWIAAYRDRSCPPPQEPPDKSPG